MAERPADLPDLTPEEVAAVMAELEDSNHPLAQLARVLVELAEAIGMPLPPVPDNPWERDALLESARRKAGLTDDEPWKGA